MKTTSKRASVMKQAYEKGGLIGARPKPAVRSTIEANNRKAAEERKAEALKKQKEAEARNKKLLYKD